MYLTFKLYIKHECKTNAKGKNKQTKKRLVLASPDHKRVHMVS